MAFSYTRYNIADATGKHRMSGTYSSASVTTGTIVTGLRKVLHFTINDTTSATCPYPSTISGGSVTVTTASNASGTWEAMGD